MRKRHRHQRHRQDTPKGPHKEHSEKTPEPKAKKKGFFGKLFTRKEKPQEVGRPSKEQLSHAPSNSGSGKTHSPHAPSPSQGSRRNRRNRKNRQGRPGQGGQNQHSRPSGSHSSGPSEGVPGTVQANEKGFGFFIPEDGTPDSFIPPPEMRGLLNGDSVLARILKDPRRPDRSTAKVLSVVKRAHPTLVGVFQKESGQITMKTDDTRIYQPVMLKGGYEKCLPGQKIVAEITKWPENGRAMEGKVVEILGFPGDPGVDLKTVIRKYNWPESFPQPVENQAQGFPENPVPSDWEGRRDLRNQLILTIDGADARDFDDAISLEKNSQGNYLLGVHIADVSHYVQENTPLDKEAQARATSLYLPSMVLPMLPHSLSDGLCSLKEGVPRLTVTALMEYTADGRFLGANFFDSVIQSSRRGIYEEVQQVLDGNAPPEIAAKYAALKPMLDEMLKLSGMIRRQRDIQGALDFDFPEVRVKLDASGKAVDMVQKERLGTHKLIEDFMVAANEAVAAFLDNRKAPTLYRIHEAPSPSDLEELKNFLVAYKVPFKNFDLASPLGLQSLLKSVKGTSLEPIVANLMLRSLKLAVYATRNAGHFALALKSYCHFTSPIRRYPDLVVHRSLKRIFAQKPGPGVTYDKLALHCSQQERAAEKAERESQKVFQLRFMEDKIGQSFEGTVRHLTAFGVFLELAPYGLEGFLPLDSLTDDEYQLDTAAFLMKGRKGGRIQLNDKMTVKVLSIDMQFLRLMLQRIYG